jgi:hypothetical protein
VGLAAGVASMFELPRIPLSTPYLLGFLGWLAWLAFQKYQELSQRYGYRLEDFSLRKNGIRSAL